MDDTRDSPSPRHATILTLAGGQSKKTGSPYSARKTINAAGETVTGYDAGYLFTFGLAPAADWVELAELLNSLANDHQRVLVMGEPARWPMPGWHRRTLADRPDCPAALRKRRTTLLPLDLDGAQPPGYELLDPVADPGECVRACVQLLPPEFRNATVWWTFTASQKVAPIPGLRLRLVFLLDQPWHLNEMKRLVRALDGRLHADGSILSGNQPIYLAKPSVTEGGADPLPRRYGLLRQAVQLVHAAPPAEPVSSSAYSASTGSGVHLPTGSDPLDLIGDHEGGAGCYQGLLHATFYLVREIGGELADADIKRAVRERALAAYWDSDKHSAEYVRQQLTDVKLDSMIRGAREKLTSEPALLAGVAPEYPAAPMSYEEATARLKTAITDAVGRAVAGFEDVTLLHAPAGLGKTTSALKQVIDARLSVVNVFVPSHKLAEELAHKVDLMGGRAQVMRGRTRSDGDPDFPMPMCDKAELVEALNARGITQVQGLLCMRGRGVGVVKCASFGHCGYARQFNTEAPIRVYTHASLALDHNIFETPATDADMTLVDESPLQSLVEHQSWPLADARAAGGLVAEIAEITASGHPLLDELRLRYDDAAEVLGQALESLQTQPQHITPDLAVADALDLLQRSEVPGHGFAPMLEAVRAALATGEAFFNGLWLGVGADRTEFVHLARRRRPIRLEAGAGKVLLLDATPNVQALRAVLNGRELSVVRISVERKAVVLQVLDTPVSKTRLQREELVRDLVGVVGATASLYGSVGVCGPKMFTHQVQQELVGEVADGRVMVANFGGLRGLDTLKGTAVGIVVGRNQPRAFDVELVARALWPHETLALSGEYMQRPIGYRMRDGRQVGTLVHDHADPRVRTVLRQMREAESEQALDRHRLVHRSEPKLILLMSKLPLDVDVDHLVRLRDLAGHPGLFAGLSKFGGVLPLGADWLSANVDGFGSAKAAERWAAKAGITPSSLKGAPRRNNPLFSYISCRDWGVIPLPQRQVTYRLLGERGRPRRAVTSCTSLQDVRTALIKLHGVELHKVVGLGWIDRRRSTLLTEGAPLPPLFSEWPWPAAKFEGQTLLAAGMTERTRNAFT